MSDREQHTAPTPPEPPPWNDSDALRASFAYELRPADGDTLRRVCELVQELARESHQMHDYPGSVVVAELRAVIADLRHIVGFLHYIGQQLGELGSFEANRLAVMAEDWAPRVADLAAEVEAALPAA